MLHLFQHRMRHPLSFLETHAKMLNDNGNFRDRVAAGYAGLSPQLRKAADFVAANWQEVAGICLN